MAVNSISKASVIQPQIQEALNGLDQLVLQQQEFDVAKEQRCFNIAANDYFELIVLPKLLPQLREKAPYVSLFLTTLTQDIADSE